MAFITGNRLGLLLGFFCVATVFLFWDTSVAIWNIWVSDDDPAYSHGPLLLLVSMWIIVREWHLRSESFQLHLSLLPMILLMGASIVWFLAALGTIQIIQILAMVFVFVLLFWSFLGFRQALFFSFPILLMLCALPIPIWSALGHYLQLIAAVIVGELVSWTIVPSVREGMLILIPAGTFEVAAGCSGLSYFMVSVIISILYVYFNRVPLRHVGFYVIAAMGVAIVANIIRIYTVVLSGQLTNMQSYFVTVEHSSLGWVIFGIFITLFLLAVQRFLPVDELPEINGVGVTKEATRQEATKQVENINPLTLKQWIGVTLLGCSVFAGPIVNDIYQQDLSLVRHFEARLPAQMAGWQKQPYVGEYHPKVEPGDLTVESSYQHPRYGRDVYLYLNYFYSQQQGDEAVNSLNHMAGGRLWRQQTAVVYDPDVDGFDDVQEFQLSARNGEKKLLWRWYETNGIRTSLGWKAKLHNILGIVSGEPAIVMIVAAAPLMGDVDSARTILQDFIKSSQSEIRVIPTIITDQKE